MFTQLFSQIPATVESHLAPGCLEAPPREYDNVAASEKMAFDRLLDLQDPELLKYLMGRERPVDQDLVAIVKKIRSVSPN